MLSFFFHFDKAYSRTYARIGEAIRMMNKKKVLKLIFQ